MSGNNEFFEKFERKKYLKKLPSMQRVKQPVEILTSPAANCFDELRFFCKLLNYIKTSKFYPTFQV